MLNLADVAFVDTQLNIHAELQNSIKSGIISIRETLKDTEQQFFPHATFAYMMVRVCITHTLSLQKHTHAKEETERVIDPAFNFSALN